MAFKVLVDTQAITRDSGPCGFVCFGQDVIEALQPLLTSSTSAYCGGWGEAGTGC